MRWFVFSWQNFWFSFLALAFEGVPFILLGSLISGIIGSFVPARAITGLLPKSRFPAILVSGLLGVIFPVWRRKTACYTEVLVQQKPSGVT